MSISDIVKLPVQQKLQIMEALWEDMRGNLETLSVPQKHREMLDCRRENATSGKSKLLDWEEVKYSIGKGCFR